MKEKYLEVRCRLAEDTKSQENILNSIETSLTGHRNIRSITI
jgi:hypothetical protein